MPLGLPPLSSYSRLGRQTLPQLTPEEEESLLRQVGRKALGGVAAFGNLLDLPGSMVRDVLGSVTSGRFQNPFDQLISPFSAENRTTGRDILRDLGLAGRRDTWGNAIGGFAAEVALDPLTYLSGGLTQAGKAARAMGILDDASRIATRATERAARAGGAAARYVGPREARMTQTLQDVMRGLDAPTLAATENKLKDFATATGRSTQELLGERLGRPFGVGIPFTDRTMPVRIPGDVTYAKMMDKVGRAIKTVAPVRHLRGALQSNLLGATSTVGQENAPWISRRMAEGEAAGRKKVAELMFELEGHEVFNPVALVRAGTVPTIQEARRMTRQQANAAWRYLEDLPGAQLTPELQPVQHVLDEMKAALPKQLDDEVSAGLSVQFLEDLIADAELGTGYFPRGAAGLPKSLRDRIFGGGRAYSPAHPSQIGRKELLKDFADGTAVIQDLSTDPRISGIAATTRDGKLTPAQLTQIEQVIRSDYLGKGRLRVQAMSDSEVRDLARWVGNLDPRHAAEQIPVFDMNPLRQFARRIETGNRAVATVGSLAQLAAEVGDDLTADVFTKSRSATTVADLTKEMFGGRGHSEHWWDRLEDAFRAQDKGQIVDDVRDNLMAGARQRELDAANAAAQQGDWAAVQRHVDTMAKIDAGDMAAAGIKPSDIWSRVAVPKEVADDMTRIMGGYTSPKVIGGLTNAFDTFLRTWKLYQTSPWPAFHSRNLVSGLAQSVIGHALDPKAIKDAFVLQFGGTIKGAAKLPIAQRLGVTTDAEATKLIRELIYEHRLSGYGTSFFDEMAAGARDADLRLPGRGPIVSPPPIGTTRAQRWNPLDPELFTPFRFGRDIGNQVESINRISPFLYLLRQGWAPDAAARRVKFLQVDYAAEAAADPFLRRVFPFWKFTKGAIQPVVDELINRPGGRLAVLLKGTAKARDETEPLPDYLQETTAIPLGNVGENKRYLTGLGLMFEDPLSFGAPVPGVGTGVREALLEGMSRTNPLLKAVGEWGTGQSFFQKGPLGGRPIEDLDPTIGRTFANIRDTITGEQTRKVEPFLGPGTEYVATSFLGRPLTTARTLTDPRKRAGYGAGLIANLLTGFRLSDISPATQDAVLREAAQSLMGDMGARTFTRQYFPEEMKLRLPPEERARIEQWEGLMRILDARMKARAEARRAG